MESFKPRQARLLGVLKRLLRFRLRTFLIFVTLFCVFCGTIGSELARVHYQQSIVAEIEGCGGQVGYTYGFRDYDERFFKGWLRRKFSSDLYNPVLKVWYLETNAAPTVEHLEVLKGLSELQGVYLSGKGITDKGVNTLSTLPHLIAVGLDDVGISPEGLHRLASLQRIEQLSLSGNFLTDPHLESLSKCTQLTNLQLIDTGSITDKGLNCLQSLSNLEQLDLYRFPALNDDSVKFLRSLKKLKGLRILPGKITDATLADIGQLPELEVLMLNNCAITDEGLDRLRDLEGLISLQLVGSSISDRGVAAISHFRSLQELVVINTRITDACVDDILKLSELRNLDVSETDLTATGILKLATLKKLGHFSATVDADQQQQIELRLQELLPGCEIMCWPRETDSSAQDNQ